MTDENNAITVGGHRIRRITAAMNRTSLWRCIDCGLESDNSTGLFQVGFDGCPMRPESLDHLSVCPGGKNCPGHMDTSSPQYRAWKESPSMPSSDVPHITCDPDTLGLRAAAQWLYFADRIGLKTTLWAQTGLADKVGAEGGHIADLQTGAGHFHIIVTRWGKLAAHNEADVMGTPRNRPAVCQPCAQLARNGQIARPTG